MKLERWLLDVWYGDRRGGWWLVPLSWLMRLVTTIRRSFYRRGWIRRTRVGVPVIVVGNITAGGTGKTPLVIWLANRLRQSGLRVGVLSRGYRGKVDADSTITISGDTQPLVAGDEAVLIARQTGTTVVVGPERVSGARQLEADGVQVIICDDGLQHYRLDRDIEIAVIDGQRGFGNGRLLPAGPLRELPQRLQSVSAVVVNGPGNELWPGALTMQVNGDSAVALKSGETRPLAQMSGQKVHAVAGMGNPERFFNLLEAHGIVPERHVFADHAHYGPEDFRFDETWPILMTEKDAVKCAAFANDRMWLVPVHAQFTPDDEKRLMRLISTATQLKLQEASHDL